MQKSVYYDKNHFEMQPIGNLDINSDEVLIKMKVCGLCGTDIHKAVDKTVVPPITLGHEIAGEVIAAGDDVMDFNVGDRVFVAHHVPCFTCTYCKRGHYSLCPQFKMTNVDPGGFSEYIRVPALHVKHTMGKLPDELSDEAGSMVEPLACCLHGFEQISINPGDQVLILGAGQIGCLQIQLANHFLAEQVIVSDVNPYRLEKAKEVGATHVIRAGEEAVQEQVNRLTDGHGADIVIISAGVSFLLEQAMHCVARGGTVLVFAPFSKNDIPIPAYRFFEDEISIVGAYSSTPYNYTPALELLKKGVIDVDKMVTHRFPLSKLNEAITLAHDTTKEVLKVLIVPDGSR
ncbi:alcohol dehydrogenase catalytic domain-containing protein [Oceanobacillus neutriphilus]|uniref:Sorbitol dehydrogenase n=1 Tax=Oceanobacillus neutriphilus TaxID=531815 RepID=A0ABQ2NS37_9BACI|nr:alcohol dehydrogenase catalytic domain-containing protein [Oceanobacillus neutriphilus]GGP09275.1 sorbitol dehydrogenase [Oceanobacillus neutriphilus]